MTGSIPGNPVSAHMQDRGETDDPVTGRAPAARAAVRACVRHVPDSFSLRADRDSRWYQLLPSS